MTGLATLVLATAMASPASAAVRSGGIDDPDDIRAALTAPNLPDLQRVDVSYDEAGSLSVSATFFEDTRQRPAEWFSTEVSLSVGQGSSSGCSFSSAVHSASMTLPMSQSLTAKASVAGFSGTIASPVSVSADGRTVSASFANAALAGRDYQCVLGTGNTWLRSYAAHPDSRYSPPCDCWYVHSRQDSDDFEDFYFTGFGPPPTPACSDGLDNDFDGRKDLADSSCSSPNGTSEGPRPQCVDGLDNDGDGAVDFGADRQCERHADTREGVDPLPTLTRPTAKRRIRSALTQEFGGAYRHGSFKSISRCDRRSRTRVKCRRVSWGVGDLGYRGWATVWYERDGDGVSWNYAFRITRTNGYCEDRKRQGDPAYAGKRCSKVFRVE